MLNKITTIQTWLAEQQCDLAFISDYHTIAYLTGFEQDPIERVLALVVFADHDPFIFAPALSTLAVTQSGWPYAVYGYADAENPFALIGEHIRTRLPQAKHWAVEDQQLTLHWAKALQTALPEAEFTQNISPKLTQMQLIKTPDEIKRMHQAGRDADLALEIAYASLQAGKTELAVAAELEYRLKQAGIRHMSFETMVQFGSNAADPHGEPGNKQLVPGELVLFDLGTVADGYVSDVSRTVAFNQASEHQRDLYQIVLEAQLTAQAAVQPGMTAGELDHIARAVITKAGYGDAFIHRLGHGIGASVHESIQIAPGNPLVLEPGMAFSIEPGIYLPGDLGIRIEDSVVLTESGAESFTHTDKTFTII